MFNFLADIFIWVFQTINVVFNSWGLSIMATAVLIRMALLPLTRTQLRSMKVMRMVQPYMKKIQDFYENDREVQGKRMMEFYSEFNINPLAGCLPSIVFFVIIFGVYRALMNPFFVGIDFFSVKLVNPVIMNLAYGYVKPLLDYDTASVTWLNSSQWQFIEVPFDIGIYLPALALAALYIGSTLLMYQYMQKYTGGMQQAGDDDDNPMAGVGNFMQKVMPVMLVGFAFIFPAGVMLYFVAQNLTMFAEYKYIPESMEIEFDEDDLDEWMQENEPDIARRMRKEDDGTEQDGGD